jgi:hypothetical protein
VQPVRVQNTAKPTPTKQEADCDMKKTPLTARPFENVHDYKEPEDRVRRTRIVARCDDESCG